MSWRVQVDSVAWVVMASVLSACSGPAVLEEFSSRTPFESVRAMWITRWDYRSGHDVKQIVRQAKGIGVTDLLFQVRGQADAFYRSPIEPWGDELLENLPTGQVEPDFDPLAVACAEAHRRGLRLHAWINVMPLWKGTIPPRNPNHLYHTNPRWRLIDQHAVPQPLNAHYVIVNPVLPEVQQHLVGVAADLAARYPIDGLHLDYIRFVAESMKAGLIYPSDAGSHALFKAVHGLEATDHPVAYRAYIRDCITHLVGTMRAVLKARRPHAVFSAAVWLDARRGREIYLQDWPAWTRAGLLDAAFVMSYTDDHAVFKRSLAEGLSRRHGAALIAGVGMFRHDSPAMSLEQLEMARQMGTNGVCLFAYHSLFESISHEQPHTPEARRLRRRRRAAVKDYLARFCKGRSREH